MTCPSMSSLQRALLKYGTQRRGKSSTHAVEQAEWLDPDLTDRADVQHVKESLPEPTLTPRIVTTRVNSTGQQRPELMNQLRGGSAGKMTSSGHP